MPGDKTIGLKAIGIVQRFLLNRIGHVDYCPDIAGSIPARDIGNCAS